ncbi:MAG: hypothetical protein WAX22_03010 [Lactococcus hircilactis]|uniref:hypothetical protein n=1 Tax=Lactococcus hircilactis TaxID=1494462 RepID=UPI003BEC0B7D
MSKNTDKIYDLTREKIVKNVQITDEKELTVLQLPEVTRLIDLLLVEIPQAAISDYLKHLPAAVRKSLPSANDFMFHVLDEHSNELEIDYKGALKFVREQLIPALQKANSKGVKK